MIALLHVASAAPPPRIAIVGSGPAGLTLAHALNTLPGAEYEATVYEKYDGVSTAVGGGLQLSSGAWDRRRSRAAAGCVGVAGVALSIN